MSKGSAADTVQQTIIDDAKAEAKRIVSEAEVAGRQRTEEALENARTNLTGWAERRRQMAQDSGDRVLGKAQNDAHMKILEAKAKIIDAAFVQARKRFEKERSQARYKTFLKNLIIDAGTQIGGSDIVVLARKEDQAIVSKMTGLVSAISKAAGKSAKVSVGKTPMDMIGGVLVQNKDGNITVDYRVDTLLGQVETQKRNEISKTLFGEEAKAE
ncbi:MAG: V-type ATP synthase subunit E [Candidatus Hermodarchaeia archaeon]|jgi:V/A-type H+-transporting ATPase subunit E